MRNRIVVLVLCVAVCPGAGVAQRSAGQTLGQRVIDERRADSAPAIRVAARDTVSLDRDLVTVDVSVEDGDGRFLEGIDRSRFEVFEDSVRQEIAFFADTDTPVTLGVVFDVSRSMEGRLDRARDALARSLDVANRDDEFFLVTFDDRPRLVRGLTSDGAAIARSLTNVAAHGDTALYDAIRLGIETSEGARHSRRALLVITDGHDTHSAYSYDELRELVRESGVQVYVIGIVDLLAVQRPASNGLGPVGELARASGGRAFFPFGDEELIDDCTTVALELRHRYSIGYYPTSDGRDGRWHKIRVKVASQSGQPRARVRAREGYYGTRGRTSSR